MKKAFHIAFFLLVLGFLLSLTPVGKLIIASESTGIYIPIQKMGSFLTAQSLTTPFLCTGTPVTADVVLSVQKQTLSFYQQDLNTGSGMPFSQGRILIKNMNATSYTSSGGNMFGGGFGGSQYVTIYITFFDGSTSQRVSFSQPSFSQTFSPPIYATSYRVETSGSGFLQTLNISYSTGAFTPLPVVTKSVSFQVSDKDGNKNIGSVNSLFPGALKVDPKTDEQITRTIISTSSHEVKMGFNSPFNSQYTVEGAVTADSPIVVCKDNNQGGYGDNNCDANQCSATIAPPAPPPPPPVAPPAPAAAAPATPPAASTAGEFPGIKDVVSRYLQLAPADKNANSRLKMIYDYFSAILPSL